VVPINGKWHCTQTTPPVPGGYEFDVRVETGGARAGFLYYTLTPSGIYTAAPGLSFECTGTGTYNALGPNGPVSGTCSYVSP
jgi:hypothetical protein